MLFIVSMKDGGAENHYKRVSKFYSTKFSFLKLKSTRVMKKAKILFAAIGIVVVVSGALAFKAAKFSNGSVFCGTTPSCSFSGYQPQFINGANTTTTPCGTATVFHTLSDCSDAAQNISGTYYSTTAD
jgi:hypothetical protein